MKGMPLTGSVSYLSVADQFLDHWSAVELCLGEEAPLNLGHGVDRATLLELRARLEKSLAVVTRFRISREVGRRDLKELDGMVERHLAEFNRQMMEPGNEVHSPEEVSKVWFEREQKGESISLEGGLNRMDFVTDISAHRLVISALRGAEKSLTAARGARDGAQDQLRALLVRYRDWVAGEFPSGHEHRESLPCLDLPDGPFPAAVVAAGRWQDDAAIITWEVSAESELNYYDVRSMAGETYESEDEVSLAVIFPGEILRVSTVFALDEVGAAASFCVYVVLRSGHERGSLPVTVVWQ
jgi:hypothetical protein